MLVVPRDSSLSLFVSEFPRVVSLFYVRDNDLCSSAVTSFSHMSSSLASLGFDTILVDVTDFPSPSSDDMACVRVPQIRLFIGGKLRAKHVGFPSSLAALSSFLDRYSED